MGQGIEVVVMVAKKDRRGEGKPSAESEDRRSSRERRQFERVLVDLEVDYRCEDTFLFAYITDISAMGIFVQTNSPEPPGTRLNLRFVSPIDSDRTMELEGEVIWINPYRPGDSENINPGMGVKFIDLTPDQRDELTHLVKTFAYLHDENAIASTDEEEDGDDIVGDPIEVTDAGEDYGEPTIEIDFTKIRRGQA